MKSILSFFCLLLLLALYAVRVKAQIHPQEQPKPADPIVFDMGIRQIRKNMMPDFRYKYDDYLQYSPAVVMFGMKAFGYQGRSSWGRMLVSDAFSVAVMAAVTNAVKYSVRRLRPDETSRNSFPSGHTATAFMAATMLHKEYGWRSPWFSIGGYSVAALVGVSRIMNNRHWATDVFAGGVIGVGSVHLGYFLSDLIFKDKHINSAYVKPDIFAYDLSRCYYQAGLWFSRRFVLGCASLKENDIVPTAGSSAGLGLMLPVVPKAGVALRGSANLLDFNQSDVNMYNLLVGGYWMYPLRKLVEFDLKALVGYDWSRIGNGVDVVAQAAVSLRAGELFRIKAFAEYETFGLKAATYIHSVSLGLTTSFCW